MFFTRKKVHPDKDSFTKFFMHSAKKKGASLRAKQFFMPFLLFIGGAATSAVGTWLYYERSAMAAPASTGEQPTIEIRFSPKGGCTDLLVQAIDKAEANIYVSAYEFSLKPFLKALLAARQRGVEVRILLDKGQYDKFLEKGEKAPCFQEIEALKQQATYMAIYDRSAYTHDKIMIIDGKSTTIGSFNFSKNAEEKNFEDLVWVKNHIAVADSCLDHWMPDPAKSKKRKEHIKIKEYDKKYRDRQKKKKQIR